MSNLILHCGAERLDRAEVDNLPEPVARGPRHQPVHHGEYIRHIETAVKSHGLGITEQAFGSLNDGDRFFGLMRVEGDSIAKRDDYGFVLGFRSAYDQSMPLGFAGGSHTFVCDNMAFFGEMTFTTKQTSRLFERLPAQVHDIVGHLASSSVKQDAAFEAYRARQMTGSVADAAMTQLVRMGIIPASTLPRVLDEWDSPSHDEFMEDGDSVYRLFQSVTETLKPGDTNVTRLPTLAPRTIKLHQLCDRLAA